MQELEKLQTLLQQLSINYTTQQSRKATQLTLQQVADEANFSQMYQKLLGELGMPEYVDSYYGYIWKTEQKFVSFGMIEEYCHKDVLRIYIFNRLPLSKRIQYADYLQTDTVVKEALKANKLAVDNLIHYFGNYYLYFAEGTDSLYIVTIKRRCVTLHFALLVPNAGNSMRQVIPKSTKKIKVDTNNADQLKTALLQCLHTTCN